jgi:hypothetical protein
LPVGKEWLKFSLTPKQIEFYKKNGYLTRVKLLNKKQCDSILKDYSSFMQDEPHPASGLFYEFHSNQTGDPNNVLMHALGHWRITENFHDLVMHPGITRASSQLMDNKPVRFWHD